MLTSWQRIEKIVTWTGLSVNAFAHCIGLKRAENLYQIKKGNHGISRDLAEMIATKYPTVNKSWLLTGMGEMFLDDNNNMAHNIPFYKVDVVRLMLARSYFTPSGYMSLPLFNGCDLAALQSSRAMEPDIPFGAIVFIQRMPLESVLPGNAHLVMSRFFKGIRFVRREPGSPELRLVPRNRQDYDEVVVEASDVDNIYEIKGFLMTK